MGEYTHIPNRKEVPSRIGVTEEMIAALEEVGSDQAYNGDIERRGAPGLIALGKATLESIKIEISERRVTEICESVGATDPDDRKMVEEAIQMYTNPQKKESN